MGGESWRRAHFVHALDIKLYFEVAIGLISELFLHQLACAHQGQAPVLTEGFHLTQVFNDLVCVGLVLSIVLIRAISGHGIPLSLVVYGLVESSEEIRAVGFRQRNAIDELVLDLEQAGGNRDSIRKAAWSHIYDDLGAGECWLLQELRAHETGHFYLLVQSQRCYFIRTVKAGISLTVKPVREFYLVRSFG